LDHQLELVANDDSWEAQGGCGLFPLTLPDVAKVTDDPTVAMVMRHVHTFVQLMADNNSG